MYANKKLQDFFPFDSTVLGLKNLYSEVGKDSFYVNSNCVVAKNKILTKGRHYIIFNIPRKSDINMNEVILLDLFYYEGNIHVISQDIHTHRVSTINFCLECPEKHCTRILVDVMYFIDKMNARAVQDYCGKCNDTKKKPNAEINPKSSLDDLLEFEF